MRRKLERRRTNVKSSSEARNTSHPEKDMQLKVESDGTSVHVVFDGTRTQLATRHQPPQAIRVFQTTPGRIKQKLKIAFCKLPGCMQSCFAAVAGYFPSLEPTPAAAGNNVGDIWEHVGTSERKKGENRQVNLLQCHVKVRLLFLFHPITQGLITVTS